ncbi:hypothetical protein RI129_007147 [Pyrocoelia pectoralis]|uniref:MD-2-related lipid-recognition domain-containing protein n=1 Tax=Pyrocoelia pectoralis TaxID=417401 RepID=A0AAN7V978_9COLE
MGRLIFSLFMLCYVIKVSESIYQDCGSTLGTLLGLEVSKCKITDARCTLHRNTNSTIAIKFSTNQEIKKVKAIVHGIVMSMSVDFPLPNSDGCVDSGLTCPLKQGNVYTYITQLPVLETYPKITVDVKWELQLDSETVTNKTNGTTEDTSKDIVCVIIPAKIQ